MLGTDCILYSDKLKSLYCLPNYFRTTRSDLPYGDYQKLVAFLELPMVEEVPYRSIKDRLPYRIYRGQVASLPYCQYGKYVAS